MSKYAPLVLCSVMVAAMALTGTQFMPGEWYARLNKPTWTPPGYLFGPVWLVLYIMIAIAGWLVIRAEGFGTAFWVWALGLIPNGLWSYLMFGRKNITLALVDIVVLWAAIVAFIVIALRVCVPSAVLYLPYLAWVSFAAALNFAIWRLSP